MAEVIAFVNHKGGVTKTTSVANLGPALVERGLRVLLVDADAQANLTECFGAEEGPGSRLEDALVAPAPRRGQVARRGLAERASADVPGGVDILPCSEELADVVAELPRQTGYEFALRDAVAPLRELYDFILIDTPPGLGVMSGMALLAADSVVIPARPADLDVGGAAKVYDLIEESVRTLNPDLEILGVLIAQTQRRWVLRRDTHAAIQDQGMRALPVEVPFSVRVGAAPRLATPTFVLEPDGRVAQAYRKLGEHLAGDRAGMGVAA